MQYTRLTADQQKTMLEQRASNLEVEHYNNTITLTTLKAAAGATPSPENQAEIDRLTENLSIIDAAHAGVETELVKFDTATGTSTADTTPTNAAPDTAI